MIKDIIKNITVQENLPGVFELLTEFVSNNPTDTLLSFGQKEFDFLSAEVEVVVRAKLDFDNPFAVVFFHYGVIERKSRFFAEIDCVFCTHLLHLLSFPTGSSRKNLFYTLQYYSDMSTNVTLQRQVYTP